MTGSSAVPQRILIFAIILPIAALLGYFLAEPTEAGSLAVFGLVIGFLCLPLVLQHHHSLLIATWHASVIVVFVKGQPYLWMLMTAISLGLTVIHRFMNPNFRPLHVPSITWTLALFGLVVFVTAQLTGGIGIRSFGASVIGGKKYYLIWFAIAGYLAISVRPMELQRAFLLAATHFGSGVTAAVSTLAYVAGPAAWILYAVFPTDYAMHLVTKDFSTDVLAAGISRFSGFGVAGLAVAPAFFIKWGASGLLQWTRPWRMGAFIAVAALSLLGGYRSTLGLFGLLFIVQFFNEGLYRTRYFPILAGISLLGLIVVYPLAGSMPLAVQRSLAALPFIPISQVAKTDAENSTKWREDMWRELKPEVQAHLWLGKGYTANETTYRLEQEAYRLGLAQDYEMMILAGDYHSGWRSILIPFGIWGLISFVLFLAAGLRVLWINRTKGEGTIRRINMFLFTYFVAKGFFFFVFFGAIASDLYVFTGVVGLSVALNRGADRLKPANG